MRDKHVHIYPEDVCAVAQAKRCFCKEHARDMIEVEGFCEKDGRELASCAKVSFRFSSFWQFFFFSLSLGLGSPSLFFIVHSAHRSSTVRRVSSESSQRVLDRLELTSSLLSSFVSPAIPIEHQRRDWEFHKYYCFPPSWMESTEESPKTSSRAEEDAK